MSENNILTKNRDASIYESYISFNHTEIKLHSIHRFEHTNIRIDK